MRLILPLLLLACGSTKNDSSTEEGPTHTPESSTNANNGDAEEEESNPEGEEDCDSELGTLAGQVVYDVPWLEGSPSSANAELFATPTQGDTIRISSNADGQFSTSLPADSYLVMAQDNDGCASDQVAIDIAACGEETITLRLTECLDGTTEGDTAEPSEDDTDTTEDDTDTTEDDTDTTEDDVHFVATICEAGPSDPYGTSGVAWDGDVLVVSVEYGGCSTGHTFTPCWDGSWDRSMPPGASLQLAHDDADEMCMMMIYEDIRIDVSTIIAAAIERTGTDPFQIRLEGHSIEYSF